MGVKYVISSLMLYRLCERYWQTLRYIGCLVETHIV